MLASVVPSHRPKASSSDEHQLESKKNLGEGWGNGAVDKVLALKCENQYSGPQHLGDRDMGFEGKLTD